VEDFIRVEHVNFRYENEYSDEPVIGVLKDVSLQVRKGEFLALLGHNGCGKSTLSKHFNAMLLPTEGNVWVEDMNTADEDRKFDIRSKVGLILQNPDNQLVASIVEEDVAFGPENLGVAPKEIRRRVNEALHIVDMYEYRRHSTHKLSGGQKQRVAIAGILAMQPECIVFDEPTSMLDPRGRSEVLNTILRLNREQNITIILITHNMDEAVLADRVIVMDGGKPVLEGTPTEVFSQVEQMHDLRLDVPQATDLVYHLRKDHGLNLPADILNEDECAQALARLLDDAGIGRNEAW
jgi:energy-coupling factor transport system ATP-binding protein